MDELDFYNGIHTGQEIDTAISNVQEMLENYIVISPSGQNDPVGVAIGTDEGSIAHYGIFDDNESLAVSTPVALPSLYLVTKNAKEARSLASGMMMKVHFSNVSSLPVTARQLMTMDTVPLEDAEPICMRLSNPNAQLGDWSVTVDTSSVTIDGAISGATDIDLFLSKAYYAAQYPLI